MLPVCLRNTLKLVLLLNSVAVAGALAGVDNLVSQALCYRLDGTKGGLARTNANQIERLVNASEGGHIHGLAAHNTTSADAGAVFTRAGVNNGLDKDLHRKRNGGRREG